jgi:hypothetical protein
MRQMAKVAKVVKAAKVANGGIGKERDVGRELKEDAKDSGVGRAGQLNGYITRIECKIQSPLISIISF